MCVDLIGFRSGRGRRQTASVVRLAVVLAAAAALPAAAPAADFYAGQTVTLIVGASDGGAYAVYGRMLAKHMESHIPGKPTIIVQAMPGAGGTKMANYMYNAAHRDGLVIGTPLAPMPITQLLRPEGVKYDAAKFQWLGNLEGSPPVLAVWHTAPVQSIEEAKTRELIVASSGKGSVTYQVPAMINRLLGTRIKIVSGYKGETDIDLAIERGEVHGRASFYGSMIVSKPQQIKDGRLRFIAQVATHEVPALKGVPNLVETAKDDETRRMFEFFALQSATGRAYFTPPGVSADRVAILRKAFDDTTASKQFDADMKTRHMLYDVTPGAEVQKAVVKMLATPKPLVERVREAIGF